jgi:hypothetical protein
VNKPNEVRNWLLLNLPQSWKPNAWRTLKRRSMPVLKLVEIGAKRNNDEPFLGIGEKPFH